MNLVRILVVLWSCSAAVFAAPANVEKAAVPTSPAKAASLASMVIDWNKIESQTKNFGSRKNFFDGPTATLKRLECHVSASVKLI